VRRAGLGALVALAVYFVAVAIAPRW